MGEPFAGADHVGGRGVERQRCFGRAEDHVAAHARREVEHHIRARVADPLGHLAVERGVAGGRAGLGVAHVAMHHRRAGLGGVERAGGDLDGAARHMRAAILRAARAGYGAGDEDLAVYGERHVSPPRM